MNVLNHQESWMERNSQWANLMMVTFIMTLLPFLIPELVEKINLTFPEMLYRIAPAFGMLSLGIGIISLFMAGTMARLTDTISARIVCYAGFTLGFVIAIALVFRLFASL